MYADRHRLFTGIQKFCICVDLRLSAGSKKRKSVRQFPLSPRPPLSPSDKEGSALIIVLSVAVVLALIVANFAADLNGELKAAGGNYEEAIHAQLSQSALALARLEIGARGTKLYANGYGDAYLIAGTEDYETAIEELQVYRDGIELGRGRYAYRLVHTPAALDANKLGQNAWHRLFEIACDMDEGTERSELVDRIIDWTDADNNIRANGMEEEDYQALDTPRHVRNGPLEYDEELLLVYGVTPELFYGYKTPVYEDEGLIRGGGLQRYLTGDNSPAGRASAQYILQGTYPVDDTPDEDEELEYKAVETLPEELYLIAEGYAVEPFEEEKEQLLFAEEEVEVLSRRYIVVKLKTGAGSNAGYKLDERIDNAPGELVDRILMYGIPEETF
jgi:hypothetical protein